MQNALYLGVLFLFYFVNYFVVVFFNSALVIFGIVFSVTQLPCHVCGVACAIKRFYGGKPTISEGLKASMNRLPQIAGDGRRRALVSASVGLYFSILRVIESRSERFGSIAARNLVLFPVSSEWLGLP